MQKSLLSRKASDLTVPAVKNIPFSTEESECCSACYSPSHFCGSAFKPRSRKQTNITFEDKAPGREAECWMCKSCFFVKQLLLQRLRLSFGKCLWGLRWIVNILPSGYYYSCIYMCYAFVWVDIHWWIHCACLLKPDGSTGCFLLSHSPLFLCKDC